MNTFSPPPVDSKKSLIAATILHDLTQSLTTPLLHPTLLKAFTDHPSTKPRLYLASALTPYASITYEDQKHKTHQACEIILREGLKLGSQNHYLDGIPTLFTAADTMRNPILTKFNIPTERVAIGNVSVMNKPYPILTKDAGSILRQLHNQNVGSTWQISMLFSLVQELVPFWNSEDSYDGMGLKIVVPLHADVSYS
jgi:tRNA nucleotidyltransferase (CCA-adding enzyme)